MKYLNSVFCLLAILFFYPFYSNAQCPMVYPTIGGSCHDLAPYWSAASGADHYEYSLDTSMSNPAGSGTATTATALTFYPLPAGIHYYFHLRSVCSGGTYSWWSTTSATTACDSITAVNISETYDSSADVNWSTIFHCETHFEYAVDTVAVPPASPAAWKSATGNSVTVKGLNPNTTYFVFVRDSCGYGLGHTAGNHFQTQPLGVQSLKSGQAQITIYPNPATNIIVINAQKTSGKAYTATLIDVYGKTIKTIRLGGDKQLIDVSSLPAGIYFIRYADEVTSQTIKFIKQ